MMFVGPSDDPDRYRLDQRVAMGGGEGELWRGSIPVDGVDVAVAVKIIHERNAGEIAEWRTRWQRQVDVLQSLDHPGIVKVRQVFTGPLPHEAGSADPSTSSLYLAMSWVQGDTLESWTRQHGERDLLDCVRILTALSDAVDYLHTRAVPGIPILHRDIKPSNILVEGGRITLVDFGITRLATGQDVTFAGTPAYLAPEALHGSFSEASDRFALGATAFFLLTGSSPNVLHDSAPALRAALEASPLLAGKPGVVDQVLAMVDRDPAKRPVDITSWAQGLALAAVTMPGSGGTTVHRAPASTASPMAHGSTPTPPPIPTSGATTPPPIPANQWAAAAPAPAHGAPASATPPTQSMRTIDSPPPPPVSPMPDESAGDSEPRRARRGGLVAAAVLLLLLAAGGVVAAFALGGDDPTDVATGGAGSRDDTETSTTTRKPTTTTTTTSTTTTLPTAMPDFTGKTLSEATNTARQLALTVTVGNMLDETVPDGTVLSQEPAGGSPLAGVLTLNVARRASITYLSDLEPVEGSDWSSSPINLNAEQFIHPLSTTAGGSEVISGYDLQRAFTRFRGKVGPSDSSPSDSTIHFEIIADGRKVFEADVPFGQSHPFDVDVTDVLRLELRLVHLYNGECCPNRPTAVWGDPTLLAPFDPTAPPPGSGSLSFPN